MYSHVSLNPLFVAAARLGALSHDPKGTTQAIPGKFEDAPTETRPIPSAFANACIMPVADGNCDIISVLSRVAEKWEAQSGPPDRDQSSRPPQLFVNVWIHISKLTRDYIGFIMDAYNIGGIMGSL